MQLVPASDGPTAITTASQRRLGRDTAAAHLVPTLNQLLIPFLGEQTIDNLGKIPAATVRANLRFVHGCTVFGPTDRTLERTAYLSAAYLLKTRPR